MADTPLDDALAQAPPAALEPVRGLLDALRRERVEYFASPFDWRDEVLYFLLPDRFSDGRESSRPLLTRADVALLPRPFTWSAWAESGKRWQGGTLEGIRGRLGYLRDLHVTAIWIGPVFKQRLRLNTYHGYGIQDFLDVDPRFGTRQHLLDLIRSAHEAGIRVVLDVVINHSGDNWGYVPPGAPLEKAVNEPPFRPWPQFYGDAARPETAGWRLAWRNEAGVAFTDDAAAVQARTDGVWPEELRDAARYTRAGSGNLGAGGIDDARAEHKRTDFRALKDFALDVGPSLSLLIDVFRYWIAVSDCDGFRIDTVKHMAVEETRNFCGAIREFADTLGKRNFLLLGEIAGGDGDRDFVLDNLAVLQRNLSAALDIGSARTTLHGVAKGLQPAADFFNQFDERTGGFESHRAFGNRHVSILDDHDHVAGEKIRFSSEIPEASPVKERQVAAGAALQLLTLGIPCIYYGTEQAFAGPPQSEIKWLLGEGWKDGNNHGDRYLREAMFGPAHPRVDVEADSAAAHDAEDPALPGFGPFGTSGKHCFDTDSPAYVRIAALCRIRGQHPVLRLGRQYLRKLGRNGADFAFPAAGQLVAWSRILDNLEAICVVNANGDAPQGADVEVAREFFRAGATYTVVANTSEAGAGPAGFHGSHPVGDELPVRGDAAPGRFCFLEVRDVPPGEVVVLLRKL